MKSEKLLKAIGEIDDLFIEEADDFVPAKKIRRWSPGRIAAFAACFVVVIAAGLFVSQGGIGSRFGSSSSDMYNMSGAANETSGSDSALLDAENSEVAMNANNAASQEPDLEKQYVSGALNDDKRCWIIIGDIVYMQVEAEGREENPKEYIGRASEYEGFYQDAEDLDGDLYWGSEAKDVVILKLDNGSIIWLEPENKKAAE